MHVLVLHFCFRYGSSMLQTVHCQQVRYTYHKTKREYDSNGMGVGKDHNSTYLQYMLKFLNTISFSIYNLHLRYFYHINKNSHRDIQGRKQEVISSFKTSIFLMEEDEKTILKQG